jgi:hypothetical protein
VLRVQLFGQKMQFLVWRAKPKDSQPLLQSHVYYQNVYRGRSNSTAKIRKADPFDTSANSFVHLQNGLG